MTAHAMEDHEAEIVAAGVDHYLTKPLKKAEIIGKLEALKPEGVLPLMQE
jgi:CheY-like chemotaxis protein